MNARSPGPLPVIYLRRTPGPLAEVVDMDGSVVRRHLLGFGAVEVAGVTCAACRRMLARAEVRADEADAKARGGQ